MMVTNNDGVLLEDMEDKMDFLVDAMKGIQTQVKHIPVIQEDIAELRSDVKTIKLAVCETNKDLGHLEKRVTRLEKARA